MDETKMIAEYILESQDNLETSLKLVMSLQQVKEQLKEKFELQLEQVATELGIQFEREKMRFFPSNWSKHTIALSYESGAILYGINRNEVLETKEPSPEIQEFFKEQFQTSYWWPMHKDFYSNINNNSEFWLDINSGKAKARIKEFVKIVNDNCNTTNY
ncbi:hypothetical protein ACQ9BO_07665 [Flavobacterium sp. P21]|uniref:hypothetical protein n=1 Tax=Flavobacterium sp. P21 TaxID=3423948 RepID=UPI003D67CD4D